MKNTTNKQETVLIYSILTVIILAVTLCAVFGNNLSALSY
jgi:hypothetical protein